MAFPETAQIPYSEQLVRLDRAIAGLIADPAIRATLARHSIRDWDNGGCLILAEAIRRIAGPHARLAGLCERADGIIEHVACEIGGWYGDWQGIRPWDELTGDAFDAGWRDPILVSMTIARPPHSIPYNEALVVLISRSLLARTKRAGNGSQS
jgi:hypothetical protein